MDTASQLRGNTMKRTIWPAVYLAGVVAANVLTQRFGLIPIGFGLVATAGTYAAAIVLISRNFSQDAIGRRGVLIVMGVGIALSWVLASPALAIASAAAFGLSETADMAIYTPLRSRGKARAVAIASSVGAVVDTVAFLWIAGFPILTALPGQLLIKISMAILAALILRGARAVLRQPIHAEST